MPLKLKLKKIPVKPMPKEMKVGIEDSPSIFPPSFHIDEKQMPEIKKWDVGEKYRLVVDIEMKSKNETQLDKINGQFDLTAYKYIPKKSVLDMNDKEFEEEEGKRMEEMSRS
ncbi:hypothetical protein LCGC14_0828670 [marine sediment metagenome]|uniref:Uncharacterized protein n=1 Tax=marine sediment metagenome TaxID=412755 RepID=A0A0F9SP13_9ZZZZ